MKQFYLAEITTKDNLVHQGIYFEPKKKGRRAILWVHGLTSTFYAGLKGINLMADVCERQGWGFASFNTRGHDMVSGARKNNPTSPKGYDYAVIGSGNEIFQECVYDINAGITYLGMQGFDEIILVGPSTGANKACYYAGSQKDPRVAAVVLVSPISDRLISTVDAAKRKQDIIRMQQLVEEGKGDELQVGIHYFPITPKRFLSLLTPNVPEDTFDYGDPKPKLTALAHITQPLLVILGGSDEAADRPLKQIKQVFDAHAMSKSYKSVIIPNAPHTFSGFEDELVSIITSWMKTV